MKKLLVVALLISAGAANAFFGDVTNKIKSEVNQAVNRAKMYEQKALRIKKQAMQDPDVRKLYNSYIEQQKAAQNIANKLKRQIKLPF